MNRSQYHKSLLQRNKTKRAISWVRLSVNPILIFILILFKLTTAQAEQAEDPSAYQEMVKKRTEKRLKTMKENLIADLYLNKSEKASERFIESAQKMHFKDRLRNRIEHFFRVPLMESSRQHLNEKALETAEDIAWLLVTKHHLGVGIDKTKENFYDTYSKMSENHYLNHRRRYCLALKVVERSKKYGPKALVEGIPVSTHVDAWTKFWLQYFEHRIEFLDSEIAHPSSYGLCTIGVYYDLFDLWGSPELTTKVGNFLTLYWAEVASEFEPKTGQRSGWATTRNPYYAGQREYWAKALLWTYGWHDKFRHKCLSTLACLITSNYRPPEILKAIARDENRGSYLMTSRRTGLTQKNKLEKAHGAKIIFDKDGNSHIRRDVYYTPDYALSTISLDPTKDYLHSIPLCQTMGVTFSSDPFKRITVMGRGYYAARAINGFTGNTVSILSRSTKANVGLERFKSDGTRIFIGSGKLWENRIEDESGWFFTQLGGAYAAIRIAKDGYNLTTRTFSWPNRQIKEIKEPFGYQLELNDIWAPIVIQMGRSSDYPSFESFCNSVKENQLTYKEGKLTYISEKGDKYEYWEKITQLPKINGETITLNPEKTYDTPYLSMKFGQREAFINYPGYAEVYLSF